MRNKSIVNYSFESLLCVLWVTVICSMASGAVNTPFTVDAEGVHLTDFDLQGSKVIFDNDFFDDIVDHTLFMGLGSYGYYDLVGIIVTRDMWEGYPNAFGMPGARHAVKRARQAGMQNIPDPVAGSMVRINTQDTEKTAGSALIIAQARLCTPEKPLVVFVGGNATTVACALIQAPDIAARMIVFTLNLGHYNGTDQTTVYELCKRAKVVNWAWTYFYPSEACFKSNDPRFQERIPPVPGKPQNSDSPGWEIKDYFLNDLLKRNIVHINQIGDGPTLVWLLNNRCFTQARKWRVTQGRSGQEVVAAGGDWDVVDICGQDYALMGETFFEWMSKEEIYTGGHKP
jgi:hypothetical protein